MRDYALTLSQPSLSTALIPQAFQCFKTILMRRKIRKALLSKGTCPVIGLAGADLRHLLALPMSCNLEIEIERIKFLSARSRHKQSGSAAQ
jgi:hypothetical protein